MCETESSGFSNRNSPVLGVDFRFGASLDCYAASQCRKNMAAIHPMPFWASVRSQDMLHQPGMSNLRGHPWLVVFQAHYHIGVSITALLDTSWYVARRSSYVILLFGSNSDPIIHCNHRQNEESGTSWSIFKVLANSWDPIKVEAKLLPLLAVSVSSNLVVWLNTCAWRMEQSKLLRCIEKSGLHEVLVRHDLGWHRNKSFWALQP